MKVFISWSGDSSKEVANFLKGWIKGVIQATNPWVSTHDIPSGTVWFEQLSEQLKDARIGILCITRENKDKPWLLFEAGALAKGLSTNKICPLLIDLEPTDIAQPLASFNHTTITKDSMYKLITTLNNEFPSNQKLEDTILKESFELRWPSFEQLISTVLSKNPPHNPANRTPQDSQRILDEILLNTRLLNEVVARFDQKLNKRDGTLNFDNDYFCELEANDPRRRQKMYDLASKVFSGQPTNE